MKGLRITLVVCVLAVAALASGLAAAQDGPAVLDKFNYLPLIDRTFPYPTRYGIELEQYQKGRGIEEAVQSGAYFGRRNALLWSAVEPTEGARNWGALAELELEFRTMAGMGIEPVVVVRSAPVWARSAPTSDCGPISANKFAAFGAFMRDAVARYSVYPYFVKYWEIWNEPDVAVNSGDANYGCWGDENDKYFGGGNYAQMLKSVYPLMKAANPDVQVLIGGLLLNCDPNNPPIVGGQPANCKPSRFLEGILNNNGAGYFDGVNYHAYDYYGGALAQYDNINWGSAWNKGGPVNLAKAKFIKSVLAAYNITDKYLVNTETSMLCTASCGADFETTKANYVAQAYAQAIFLNERINIWYDLFGSWRQNGLMDTQRHVLPAYTAYQFSRKLLGSAILSKDLTAGTVTGYEFRAGDRWIWVVWSTDGGSHTLNLPGTPTAMYDVLGAARTPAASITLDWNAIYLVWAGAQP